jgi:hypothetical protein
MFSKHKLHTITPFYENESGGTSSWEIAREISSVPKKEETKEVSQIQKDQESITAKRWVFLEAQKKTIALSSSLESIANQKVSAVLETDLYRNIKDEALRKKMIQEVVSEFMTKYAPEYEAMKASLKWVQPTPSDEDIAIELEMHESLAFEKFINEKRKEIIEKRKEQRKQRYLKSIKPTENEELDRQNQELVAKFSVDYAAIRSAILTERPELKDNNDELRNEIRKAIDAEFLLYCSKNGIAIDESILWEGDTASDGESKWIDIDITEGYVKIETKWSILIAQQEFTESAAALSLAAQVYQQEASRFEKLETIEKEQWIVYDLPQKIIELPPGESSSFLGTTGSSEAVYEATREPDGEYTLKFNGHTLKNLPKEEVEVIVDLNAVPVINSIFTADSALYVTLLNEYKFLCMVGATNPLENPPLGLIDFLYTRLNDAYLATLPENTESSLLWFSISGMWFKERGKYIRNVLSTNIELRNQVTKKLLEQKILLNGKINLSRYPR